MNDVHICNTSATSTPRSPLAPVTQEQDLITIIYFIKTGLVCNRKQKQGTGSRKCSWTHLLGPEELVGVLVEQVEGLRRALPLVHVARDEDPLHAHLQLPRALPPLALSAARVPLLAPLPRVAGRGRHVRRRAFTRTVECLKLNKQRATRLFWGLTRTNTHTHTHTHFSGFISR